MEQSGTAEGVAPGRGPVVVHTTDLSGDDGLAFAHAVALAAHRRGRLVSIHACRGPEVSAEMPSAERLLERWRGPEAPQGLVHEKLVHQCCDETIDTLLDALRHVEPDLVVAATHGRTGLARMLSESIAEAVARNVRVPTLLVPLSGDGFVDPASGAVRLGRLLLPVGDGTEAAHAVRAACALASLAGADDVELLMLHVDDGRPSPEVEVPDGFRVSRRTVKGSLEQSIVEVARESRACAIVMATHGHDTMRDVVLGSHTERVLHVAECPILSVPLS